MFAAASNPCRIGMGVTTKGYDKWGNYYWTIKKTHPGDYIYGSTSLFWGGVAYPNWWIPGPKLTTTAVAAGTGNGCLGAPSLSWDTYLP
jgi:hypothetical protein